MENQERFTNWQREMLNSDKRPNLSGKNCLVCGKRVTDSHQAVCTKCMNARNKAKTK